MIELAVIAGVALAASALTFFSGFGLGTLLLPAFALFVPPAEAVAMTAIVHGLNGLLKVQLTYRDIDWAVLKRFGFPALLGALLGAALLGTLAELPVVYAWRFGSVTPIGLVIGLLLLGFVALELHPRGQGFSFDARWLPLGGALSGFFGGLAGLQGALRTAFLARVGLCKTALIATGAAIACVIDAARLTLYAIDFDTATLSRDPRLLGVGVIAAFIGTWWGNRQLKKVTLPTVQKMVAVMLLLVALGLLTGVLGSAQRSS
jgi:uncharacterized protein